MNQYQYSKDFSRFVQAAGACSQGVGVECGNCNHIVRAALRSLLVLLVLLVLLLLVLLVADEKC